MNRKLAVRCLVRFVIFSLLAFYSLPLFSADLPITTPALSVAVSPTVGDINNDGVTNITDVILCLRQAIGLDTVNPALADMNGDTLVNITDVILILRKAIGLPDTVPSTATAVIGPSGGSIVSTDGNATVEVPPGALPADTTLNVAIERNVLGQIGWIYQVTRQGTNEVTFLTPVTITVKYNPALLPEGAAEEDLKLGLLGPFDSWYILPDSFVDTNNHKITATTVHFSDIGVLPTVSSAGNCPKLAFPLTDRIPYGGASNSVTVNSVFDHSMTEPYTADGKVEAFNGEVGTVRDDASGPDYKNLYGYKKSDDGNFFINNEIKYSGGGTLHYDGHPGYDFRTIDQGDFSGHIPVRAAADGTIEIAGSNYGEVRIKHQNDYRTRYLHLDPSSINVKIGDTVVKGTQIGISAGTGLDKNGKPDPNVFAPHLHFEVQDGHLNPIDPYKEGLWEIGSSANPQFKVIDQFNNPVSGAYVILHNSDGSVGKYATTGSNGLADLGSIAGDHVTMTIANHDSVPTGWTDSYTIWSFVNISLLRDRPNTWRVWNDNPVKLGTINVEIPGYSSNVWLEPFGQGWSSSSKSVDVYVGELQTDGKLSIGASYLGSPVKYGFLTDQLFWIGGTYTVNLNKDFSQISFTSNIPVTDAGVSVFRKGLNFGIGYQSFYSPVSSGSLAIADQVPADTYIIFASNDTCIWEKKIKNLPRPFSINMPNLSIDNSTFDGKNISWTASGSAEKDITCIRLNYSNLEDYVGWYVYMDPSNSEWTNNLKLPPEISLWLQDKELSGIEVQIDGFDCFSGFEDFIRKLLEYPNFPSNEHYSTWRVIWESVGGKSLSKQTPAKNSHFLRGLLSREKRKGFLP